MRPGRVIVCEALTVAWYIYLLACTEIALDLYSIVTALDRTLIVLAALAVAWATWKRLRWAPKAAVVVAALVGLPTFATTVGRLEPILITPGLAPAALFAAYPIVLLAQLVAFIEGLGQLRTPDAAA